MLPSTLNCSCELTLLSLRSLAGQAAAIPSSRSRCTRRALRRAPKKTHKVRLPSVCMCLSYSAVMSVVESEHFSSAVLAMFDVTYVAFTLPPSASCLAWCVVVSLTALTRFRSSSLLLRVSILLCAGLNVSFCIRPGYSPVLYSSSWTDVFV